MVLCESGSNAERASRENSVENPDFPDLSVKRRTVTPKNKTGDLEKGLWIFRLFCQNYYLGEKKEIWC